MPRPVPLAEATMVLKIRWFSCVAGFSAGLVLAADLLDLLSSVHVAIRVDRLQRLVGIAAALAFFPPRPLKQRGFQKEEVDEPSRTCTLRRG